MEFFLGSITGFVVGFGLLFISYHKNVITSNMIALRSDVSALQTKIDEIFNSLHK